MSHPHMVYTSYKLTPYFKRGHFRATVLASSLLSACTQTVTKHALSLSPHSSLRSFTVLCIVPNKAPYSAQRNNFSQGNTTFPYRGLILSTFKSSLENAHPEHHTSAHGELGVFRRARERLSKTKEKKNAVMCLLEHFCRHVTQSALVVLCDLLRLRKTGEAHFCVFSQLVVYSIWRHG